MENFESMIGHELFEVEQLTWQVKIKRKNGPEFGYETDRSCPVFAPFWHKGNWYAIYSDAFFRTRVMDLQDGSQFSYPTFEPLQELDFFQLYSPDLDHVARDKGFKHWSDLLLAKEEFTKWHHQKIFGLCYQRGDSRVYLAMLDISEIMQLRGFSTTTDLYPARHILLQEMVTFRNYEMPVANQSRIDLRVDEFPVKIYSGPRV